MKIQISSTKIKLLQKKAFNIRKDIIKSLTMAGSGHLAGSLGMTDIFTCFYFHILQHKPKNSFWEKRDYLILSNGHICPVRYVAMAHSGYFSKKELFTLRKFKSRLQGHPERQILPGVETTSGPLGSGLGQAAGISYGLLMDKKKNNVYCISSDAEQQIGAHWEAVMFASANELNNLTLIIDRNQIQISGKTKDVLSIEPLKEKYKAFNWHVQEINGHNIKQIISSIQKTTKTKKPCVIIANTIASKGIKKIENDYKWHGKVPTKLEEKTFLKELY